MRQGGHFLPRFLEIEGLACFVDIPLVDLIEEGQAGRFLCCCVLLFLRNFLIRKLYAGQTQMLQPGIIDDPVRPVPIVTIEINIADFDHLMLRVRLENFTHSVSQDRHEVLVD